MIGGICTRCLNGVLCTNRGFNAAWTVCAWLTPSMDGSNVDVWHRSKSRFLLVVVVYTGLLSINLIGGFQVNREIQSKWLRLAADGSIYFAVLPR